MKPSASDAQPRASSPEAGNSTAAGEDGADATPSVTMDADLRELLEARRPGSPFRPGPGKRAKAVTPASATSVSLRRQRVQLAANALNKALRPVAEHLVLLTR